MTQGKKELLEDISDVRRLAGLGEAPKAAPAQPAAPAATSPLTNMKVFVAIITTPSYDTYAWVYAKKPTRKQIITRLVDWEGSDNYEFYNTGTNIVIEATEIL
jgi:hypothetical protein